MKQETRGGVNPFVPWALVVLLLGALLAIGLIYGPPSIPLRNMVRMSELIQPMRIQLLEAIENEKNAVLATTDAASKSFADQARQAADRVESSRREMDATFHQENDPRMAESMNEFNSCWVQFRKLDEVILELATQNSNLKAQRLSASQCAHEIELFEAELNGLIRPRVKGNRCDEVVKLSYEALTASLKIMARHKPHIEAASDEEMGRIERRIQADDALAKKALATLGTIPDLSGDEHLKKAMAAYDRFMSLTAEVLRLSRLNTNIKSAELSLGKKRLIATQCQEALTTLQKSINDQLSKGTR